MVAADETTGYRDADTLRELYHGDGLSQAEIAERFEVSSMTISRYMREFDIETRSPAAFDASREELVEELKRLAANHESVSQRVMNQNGKYAVQTYQDEFGQWSDAKRAAGLETVVKGTGRTDVTYRDRDTLRRLYHDERLSTAKIAERYDCDRKTIDNWMHRFEIEIDRPSHISSARQGEIYNQVEFTCAYCGETESRPASATKRTEYNFCGQDCYRAWSRENQSKLPDPPDTTVPTDDLITDLQRLAEDLDRPPSYQDILDQGKYTPPTHVRRFGSIPEAREAAGLEKHIPFGKRGIRLKTGERHPYGENWRKNREKRIQHDNEQCVVCGLDRDAHRERFGVDIHVHHIVSAVEFDDLEEADKIDNLVTLCATHHREWERIPVIPDRR